MHSAESFAIASTPPRHTSNMPSIPGLEAFQSASLLDPTVIKQQLKNGDSQQDFHSATSPLLSKPHLSFSTSSVSDSSTTNNMSSPLSQDSNDAHFCLEDEGRTKPAPAKKATTPLATPQYDPKQLLNPKSFDGKRCKEGENDSTPRTQETAEEPVSSNANPQFMFDSPGSASSQHYDDQDKGGGTTNLIERMHNITRREERPAKKQKTVHQDKEEPEAAKVTFAGGGKGGEIGEYMKSKRKEGQEEAGAASTVIDLTAGEFSDSLALDI